MLAALVFHPRSKTRSFILLGWFCFILIFHFLAFVKKQSPSVPVKMRREPTTVTRLCLGTRPRVGRAWFPRHASWEQAGRMGHFASSRCSCGARDICAGAFVPPVVRSRQTRHSCFPMHALALSPKLMRGPLPSSTYLHRWMLSQKICRPRESITI